MTVHPVPVDEHGLRTDRLAAAPVGAVVVTRTHQSPTGVVLSPARRRAGRVGPVDGCIRHRGRLRRRVPLRPAPRRRAAGCSPDHVVTTGPCRRGSAPGLRLGWLVAPRPDGRARAARRAIDHMTASLIQATFAEFLELRRPRPPPTPHRRTYRERRDAVVESLAERLPDWQVAASAGLQAFVTLPEGQDKPRRGRARAARRRGVPAGR